MKVKLYETFGPDIGERYCCELCKTEKITEDIWGVLYEHRVPSDRPEGSLDDELDNLRDAHYKAQDGGYLYCNTTYPCLDCLQAGTFENPDETPPAKIRRPWVLALLLIVLVGGSLLQPLVSEYSVKVHVTSKREVSDPTKTPVAREQKEGSHWTRGPFSIAFRP